MTKLTILLPTFNGARYLREQLDSILAQSDPDFLLLAIDDGSDDDSVALLDAAARADPRVRRLPSEGNRGQRARLRELIEAATSEFVAIADQDDVWHPERNRRLLAAIGPRAIAFGRSQLIDADGTDLQCTILDMHRVDPSAAGPLQTLFAPLVSAHAAIVRRDWLDVAVLHGPVPFDWAIGLEAMLTAGLAYVDDAIVFHRLHAANQMNGAVVRAPSRLVSLSRLRDATSFVRRDRLYLFQLLDQLSRSATLDRATRLTFEKAAHACRYAWFHPLSFRSSGGRALARRLEELLGPLAASHADREGFSAKLRSVTSPQWVPGNVAEAARRYRAR